MSALATISLLLSYPPVSDTLTPTYQNLNPVGARVSLPVRFVDSASLGPKMVALKTNRGLAILDADTRKIVQELPVPRGGTSWYGLATTPDNRRIYLSGAQSSIWIADWDGSRAVWQKDPLTMPAPSAGGAAFPTGVAVNGSDVVACSNRGNELVVFSAGKPARRIATDVAPYDVELLPGGRTAIVSCWSPALATQRRKAPSSGTQIPVDAGGKAVHGTLLKIDLESGKILDRIRTGLQPTEIALSGDRGFVACSNDDAILSFSLRDFRPLGRHPIRLNARPLAGSAPNALALSPDANTLYVALGGENNVAVVDVQKGFRVTGFFPTDWYPASLTFQGGRLIIANAKGLGSRAGNAERRQVYENLGTVNVVDEVAKLDLRATSEAARKLAPSADARVTRSTAKPVPVPARLGDPSVFKHVVYIIKENRTYDQVFGAFGKGDGEPKLCIYGRDVTPNHHALAEQFVLLDNYYCNGINSADGHAWAVEGNATTHLERSFGGWTRSYPFGDDPLSVSSTGFVWDAVLGAGLTFRNYGEFDYATPQSPKGWKAIYDAFIANKPLTFSQNIGVARLRDYSCPDYPGWNMGIPDVVRASRFLKEFRQFEAQGTFPNFTIIYLPQDHTSGTTPGEPTPRATVADNDLALGRVVEAISKSRFWKETVIFVNEDDPQDGYDHIDGHRSLCLVISPYTRRGAVVSQFYNQGSVLRTALRILGVGPLNRHVAASPLMTEVFQTKPNFSTFAALPNRVPLDELNPPARALSGEAKRLALASAKLDLAKPDQGGPAQSDILNRAQWHSRRGLQRYPAGWAGAHGRGLKKKGLRKDQSAKDDD